MAELQRVEIKCQEPKCDGTRMVHHASLHEVTRCWDCQTEYKRRKARERYRRRKGLPLDYIPKSQKKKKTKEAEAAKIIEATGKKVGGWNLGPRTPEESRPDAPARPKVDMDNLLELLGDDTTIDDW